MPEIEKQSFVEHVKSHSMWGGNITKIALEYIYGLNNNKIYKIPYGSPLLFQIINEIVTNPIDLHTRLKLEKSLLNVTKIKTTIDKKTGIITCWNDGKAISDTPHFKGGDKHILEQIFCSQFCGSNLKNGNSEEESIIGGINGIGAKLANIHSKWFKVISCNNGKPVILHCICGEKEIESSIEYPIEYNNQTTFNFKNTKHNNYVYVEFLPKYETMGYDTVEQSIIDWFEFRMTLISFYLPDVKIYFNDTLITPNNLINELLKCNELFINNSIYTSPKTGKKYGLTSYIFISNNILKSKSEIYSIINGLSIFKGHHIDNIKKTIKDKVNNIVKKELDIDYSYLLKDVTIIITGQIPEITFSDQSKTELKTKRNFLNNYVDDNKIMGKLCEYIVNLLVKNKMIHTKDIMKEAKKMKKITYEKYIPASNLREGKKNNILLIGEGDSAIALLKKIRNKLGANKVGIISLGGVIINVLRNITVGKYGNIIESEKLEENEVIQTIKQCLLLYDYFYICTDQDVDGIGKICNLVLLVFMVYRRELLDKGRVKRLITPIIRIYKNNKVINEFYYEQKDLKLNNNEICKYYKGLGANENEHINKIIEHMIDGKNLLTIKPSEYGYTIMQELYSKDSARRKELLKSDDNIIVDIDTCVKNKAIMLEDQMLKEGGLYKFDCIKRQMPHLCDGLNPSKRKIIHTLMEEKNIEKKLYQWIGNIADKSKYEHGDSSLTETAKGLFNYYPGSPTQILPVKGIGQIGTRDKNGKDCAESRYVSMQIQPYTKLLFGYEDLPLLQREIQDGTEVEPIYYVSIIPLIIINNYDTTTEGFRIMSFGRDFNQVIKIIFSYLNTGYLDYSKLYISIKHFENISFIEKDNKYLAYNNPKKINDKVVLIDNLPPGLSTDNYIYNLNHTLNFIKDGDNLKRINNVDIIDESANNVIRILIYLNKDCMYAIDEVLLKSQFCKSIKPILNFRTPTTNITEYNNHFEVLKCWLDERQKLYIRRIKYYILQLQFDITRKQNVIKYVGLIISTKTHFKNEKNIIAFIEDNNILKWNVKLSNNPLETTTEQDIVSSGNYDYILDIKNRHLSKEYIDKLQNEIDNNKNKIDIYNQYLSETPPCASYWKQEIQQLLEQL